MTQMPVAPFSKYQRFAMFLFGGLLFTVVLDFMLLPALSATLMEQLTLTTQQFGIVASAYAFSAGVSALVSSGFADRFDRKKYLIFFYFGFLIGLIVCGLSQTYEMLLIGRIITGLFGGVIASVVYAIIADLFETDQRGRAMGQLQIAFAASLVIGLPLILVLSTQLFWQLAYAFVLVVGAVLFLILFFRLQPIAHHLASDSKHHYWQHLLKTFINSRHLLVFSNNTAIVFGDVLFMTFFAAFCTNNLHLPEDQLPILYGVGGLIMLIAGPVAGKLADRFGHFNVFFGGSLLAILMLNVYTNLSDSNLWILIPIHGLFFTGVTVRMVTSGALATLVPYSDKRGSFMSVDASIQQLAAGLAAVLAGWVIHESANGSFENMDVIGYLVSGFMLVTIILMHLIRRSVNKMI